MLGDNDGDKLGEIEGDIDVLGDTDGDTDGLTDGPGAVYVTLKYGSELVPLYSEDLTLISPSCEPSVGATSSQSNQPVLIPNFVYSVLEIQPNPVASKVKDVAPVPVMTILVAPSVGLSIESPHWS